VHYDVLTLGETMTRLSPPSYGVIGQSEALDLRIGGAESNVAIALARLGVRCAWLSRVTDNPLGRRMVGEISAQGVDTSHVIWVDEGRVGTYFIEYGQGARVTSVIYDRADSAITGLCPEEIRWDVVAQARLVHLTGITVALSDSCERVVDMMVDRARAAGAEVSFDVNYRSKLWSPNRALERLKPIMAKTDIVFVSSRDAEVLFGSPPDSEGMARHLSGMFPRQAIVITMGSAGAVCIWRGRVHSGKGLSTVAIDRFGGGDAFAAGYLFAHINGKDPALCLRYGDALAGIKRSIPGDMARTGRDELHGLVGPASAQIRQGLSGNCS